MSAERKTYIPEQRPDSIFDKCPLMGKSHWYPEKRQMLHTKVENLADAEIINRAINNGIDIAMSPDIAVSVWFQDSVRKYSDEKRVDPMKVFEHFKNGFTDCLNHTFFALKDLKQSPFAIEGKERLPNTVRSYQQDFIQVLEIGHEMKMKPDTNIELAKIVYLVDPMLISQVAKLNEETKTFSGDDIAKIILNSIRLSKKPENSQKDLNEIVLKQFGDYRGRFRHFREERGEYLGVSSSILLHSIVEFETVFENQIKFYVEQKREMKDSLVDPEDEMLFDHVFMSRVNSSLLNKQGKLMERPVSLTHEYKAIKTNVAAHIQANPLLSKAEIVGAMIRNSENLEVEFSLLREKKRKENLEIAQRFQKQHPDFDIDFMEKIVEVHGADTIHTITTIKHEVEVMEKKVSINNLKAPQLLRTYGQIYKNGYAKKINYLRYTQFLDDAVKSLKKQFPQFDAAEIIEVACYNPISGLRDDEEIYNHTDLHNPLVNLEKMIARVKASEDYALIPDNYIAKAIIRSPDAQRYVLTAETVINPLLDPSIIKNLESVKALASRLKK